MRISYLLTFALLLSLASSGECQTVGQRNGEGFFGGWFERVSHTQAEQPHWLAPIFTGTPRLEETLCSPGMSSVVTAFFGATIPTGAYSNGARDTVVTPTLGLGKGWGNFDVQSTVGVAIKYRAEPEFRRDRVLCQSLEPCVGAIIACAACWRGCNDFGCFVGSGGNPDGHPAEREVGFSSPIDRSLGD